MCSARPGQQRGEGVLCSAVGSLPAGSRGCECQQCALRSDAAVRGLSLFEAPPARLLWRRASAGRAAGDRAAFVPLFLTPQAPCGERRWPLLSTAGLPGGDTSICRPLQATSTLASPCSSFSLPSRAWPLCLTAELPLSLCQQQLCSCPWWTCLSVPGVAGVPTWHLGEKIQSFGARKPSYAWPPGCGPAPTWCLSCTVSSGCFEPEALEL